MKPNTLERTIVLSLSALCFWAVVGAIVVTTEPWVQWAFAAIGILICVGAVWYARSA